MKNILLLFIPLIPAFLFAQYPATGNKQRLGYQTTGDGLIWRGVAADTAIKPRTINNAYFQLDTVNGILRRYIATRGKWQTVSGGSSALTMPFDSITFNPTTVDPDTAELKYNADLETFVFGADGTIIEIGQKTAWYVKNQSGSTINKGTVVRAAGTLGSSGRILIEPMEIDGTVNSRYLLGITASNIANGADGYVIHFGKLRKFNTSAWTDGSVLYADAAGGLTATEPNPPDLRLPIAFVVHSHAVNGVLAIRIQTGNMLDELHDVDTTGIDNGGVIVWNTASEKWEASDGAAITTADTTSLLATKYWTGANFFPIQGGTLTGTGGAGFIGFPSQVSAPSTPASGLNVYAQGSSFNWKGTDGYERQFASTLTGGRTYTLPNVNGTFALGTGTANLVPLWTATNTLGSSNIQDNGTAISILNSKPFMLGQWATAGRPSGVNGYGGFNTTTNWPEYYSSTGWFAPTRSALTGGIGSNKQGAYYDANGRLNASSIMTWDEGNKQLLVSSASGNHEIRVGNSALGNRMTMFAGGTIGLTSSKDFGISDEGLTSTIYFITQASTNNPRRVGIGTNSPDTRSIVDVSTTSLSFLLPRMTAAQRIALASNPSGIPVPNGIVTQTDGTRGLYRYDQTAAAWKHLLEDGEAVTSNIYTADGNLGGNRTVTGGSSWLNLNGNVGIKKSSPTEDLDIDGDVYIRDTLKVYNKILTDYTSTIEFGGLNGDHAYGIGFGRKTGFGATSLGLYSFDRFTIGFASGPSDIPRYYFTNNGQMFVNVVDGVSTLPASAALTVNGSALIGSNNSHPTVPPNSLRVRGQGIIDSTLILTDYGMGNKTATALGKTQTNLNAVLATDGTVIELERKRDTTIFVTADTDYDFSAAVTTAQIASRYNRIIIHMTLTSGVGADKTTTLHTPDANLMQCEILIRGTDNTGTYDNEINFGTNNAISSDGTNTSGYTLAQGQGLHVRVVYNGSSYKYIYY